MDTTLNQDVPKGEHSGDAPKEDRPNKYLYPEFEGYSGERYLDSLIQQILPYALWRTWHYAVDYQAPDNVCYVGTARIASRVKPGIRKIELDLQELESRQLMLKYSARLPVMSKSGTVRHEAVTVKDFTALYALAHEYHLWTHSEEYIEADRNLVDLILQDMKLLAKVIRFDNYRRLIECKKPGRKPLLKAVHLYYQCTLPQEQPEQTTQLSNADIPDTRTSDQNTNLYFNVSDKPSSPYRESRNLQVLSQKDSESNGSEEGVVAAATIRNTPTEQLTETKGTEEEIHPVLPKPKPKQPNPPAQEEVSRAERAIETKEYDIEELKRDPMAMAAALLEMREHQAQMQPSPTTQSQKPKKDQRPRRGIPDPLARRITWYAQQFGRPAKAIPADITRVAKIYYASTQIFTGFRNDWFVERLEAACAEAGSRRGIKNRMAYFFSCLEKSGLEFSPEELAFIRSDEPLYKDGHISDFLDQLRRQHMKSESTLEYSVWIQQTYLAPGSPQQSA